MPKLCAVYNQAKKFAFKWVPAPLIKKVESLVRLVLAWVYKGSNHVCTVCDRQLHSFVRLNNDASDLLCPACGSLARKRFLSLLIEDDVQLPALEWLHFTPSAGLTQRLRQRLHDRYHTCDFQSQAFDSLQDIQALTFNDSSFDRIICYHVLEHVPNDQQAMLELYRVLRPAGKAYLQVPFNEAFDEDLTVSDEQERLARFGQEDHVRAYTLAVFESRLKAAGFHIQAVRPTDQYESLIQKAGLNPDEVVLVATRQ